MKISEDIVSPLNLVSNRYKRVGVLGNYVQIVMSVCALRKDFKDSRLYVPYTEEQFIIRKKLIEALQLASNDYLDLKGRDLCDVVKAVVNTRMMTLHLPQMSYGFTERQLRVLAKRTALALGSMSQRSREIVMESFSKVDFYDNDLVAGLLKYKLVKGSGKR